MVSREASCLNPEHIAGPQNMSDRRTRTCVSDLPGSDSESLCIIQEAGGKRQGQFGNNNLSVGFGTLVQCSRL